MATIPLDKPSYTVTPSPFPAASKTVSGAINNINTTVNSLSFTDKIVLTISQAGKLSHWIHVPLATSAADPMNPGPIAGSYDTESSLLPLSHLTATTVLGGTRRDDETVGQTLATILGSAILMRRPSEERMLILGLGLENAAEDFANRTQFDELVGLVLQVL